MRALIEALKAKRTLDEKWQQNSYSAGEPILQNFPAHWWDGRRPSRGPVSRTIILGPEITSSRTIILGPENTSFWLITYLSWQSYHCRMTSSFFAQPEDGSRGWQLAQLFIVARATTEGWFLLFLPCSTRMVGAQSMVFCLMIIFFLHLRTFKRWVGVRQILEDLNDTHLLLLGVWWRKSLRGSRRPLWLGWRGKSSPRACDQHVEGWFSGTWGSRSFLVFFAGGLVPTEGRLLARRILRLLSDLRWRNGI